MAKARILSASAGSGKTYRLAYQYVRDALAEPGRYRHILAVTFTNKATEEMKSRILERIHELASGEPSPYLDELQGELRIDERELRARAREVRSAILHDYSHFTVLTIDKFFQRILRAFIRELGIAPDYNTEIETDLLVRRGADLLVDQITTDTELRRWMMEFAQERIEEGSTWDIREGVLALSGELFKERNRQALESGRSKKDLHRIVERITAAARRSQAEMQALARRIMERIGEEGLTVDDFPNKSKGFMAYVRRTAEGAIEAYGARMRDACEEDKPWKGSAEALRPELQPLLRELCALYDRHCRFWHTTALLRENYRSFALLADLYARVRGICDEENTLLLSETKHILSEFIGHNDAPFIYEKAGTRYDRFLIDEFQDTSVREWENFLPLLQNAVAQSEDTAVLLVGDIKQSIYRWRGGDWRILHSAAREALGAENTEIVRLRENYRSLPEVVEFNNRIIGRAVAADNAWLNDITARAHEEGLLPDSAFGELADTLADAYGDHEQIAARRSDRRGFVRVAGGGEEAPLVEWICEMLDRGFRPCDILILVRSNREGTRIAEKLLAFKYANEDPRYRFDVMTQEALTIGSAPICGFLAATLRLAVRPSDTMARALHDDYLGFAAEAPLPAEELEFLGSLRPLSPEEAFERIVLRYRLHERRDEIAYLQAFHDSVIRFCSRRTADIPLFLEWWNETGCGQSLGVERSATTVGIMTIHKAKGLQNKVVILPCCSWPLDPEPNKRPVIWSEAWTDQTADLGAIPIYYKKEMEASHFSEDYFREMVYTHVDNINLLYVAFTRAEEALLIYVPKSVGRNVGTLLQQCLDTEEAEEELLREFGEAAAPATSRSDGGKRRHLRLDDYPTSEADLRLRLPSQRYFETEEEPELAPRNLGILLHRAFEGAETAADIAEALRTMRTDGLLSQEEAAALQRDVDEAFADERVREWFGDGWDRVRNETAIVVPHDSRLRRPDRVMVRGDRAVVVDYKFGELDAERYRRQLGEYAGLLRRMGYTRTEGYLWYVRRKKIERVI